MTSPVDYVRHGWALVPIPSGQKGPHGKTWNLREKCVTTEARAERLKANVGLAHAYSGTCSIDIDDLEKSATWLAERGVDLRELLAAPDAVRIASGRPNRAKLIYRLADPLPSKKIAENKQSIIDFRCGTRDGRTVQDVLPPSIHPDTEQPYRWEYGDELVGDWRSLPDIPAALLEVWRSIIAEPEHAHDPDREHVDIATLRELLQNHDATCDRDQWVRVLAAIHYETGGSAEGLALADEWSKGGGDKYAGLTDVKRVWRSFHNSGEALITAASLRVDTPADDEDFDQLEAVPAKPVEVATKKLPTKLPFEFNEDEQIVANLFNLRLALKSDEFCGLRLGFDTFRDEIMVAPRGSDDWRPFSDADYVRLRFVFEVKGFKAISRDLMRDAVAMVAEDEKFDSAILWLNGLEWDGVPRVENFLARYMGATDTPYSRAVSLYMWTALAGRVMEPGCKADMAPVLIGRQGARKTSGVAAMVPSHDHFVEVNLMERDVDLSRKLRGRLVGEIGELRGLGTRDLESIKAFISRTHEDWIPKYREFTTKFPRRLIFIGTTNHTEFLADETGNRRWLPVHVGELVDVDGVKADRLQLWAEAREIWSLTGVAWDAAERLANDVHVQHMVSDVWQENIEKWLASEDEDEWGNAAGGLRCERPFTLNEVLEGALDLDIRTVRKGEEHRVGKILRLLGYAKNRAQFGGERQIKWERIAT